MIAVGVGLVSTLDPREVPEPIRWTLAFLVALVLSIFPWAAGYFVGRLPADLQPWVTMLTFQPHLDNLFKGVVDTRDLVYWAGVTAVFLHAAVYSLERRRWTA